MAYSTNPATLRKIEAALAPLILGRSCSWHRPLGNMDQRWALRWAYKVREGLAVARRHPKIFPAIAAVAHLIKVEVRDETLVEALFIAHLAREVPAVHITEARDIVFEEESTVPST